MEYLTDHQENSIIKSWEELRQGIQWQHYFAIFHLCYTSAMRFIILSLKTCHAVHMAEKLTAENT